MGSVLIHRDIAVHIWTGGTFWIGRIVIDPRNPEFVCVAAGGDLWGPSKDRGLYKTTDGGKTWTHPLFVNEDTGCSDLVTDLTNPDVLYTSAYQRPDQPEDAVHDTGSSKGAYRRAAAHQREGHRPQQAYQRPPDGTGAGHENSQAQNAGQNPGRHLREADGNDAGDRVALVRTAQEMPVLVELSEEDMEAAGDDDADTTADGK